MKVQITMADFLPDKKNCERRGGGCPRKSKRFPNGYVIGSLGVVSGIIYCCPNYEGRLK